MKKIIELNVLIIVFSIIYMPASLGADKILPLQKLLVGNIIETIHKNKLRSG